MLLLSQESYVQALLKREGLDAGFQWHPQRARSQHLTCLPPHPSIPETHLNCRDREVGVLVRPYRRLCASNAPNMPRAWGEGVG